ncbi:MAG: HYR domain-containing protein [Bacteroidales bacterium]|nr:HYR domain-containing protein [Bacteroidales bacterium]
MKAFFLFLLIASFTASYAQHPGNALDFDGTNDIVNCGSNAVLDDLASFTVEAWINPRSFGGGENGIIIQKRDVVTGYWMLSMQNTGGEQQLEFIVNATSPARARSAIGSVELNRWMHVAAVYNGATMETSLFINGVEVDYDMHVTGTGTHFSDADNSVFIGSNVTASRIFDGTIDEVRIWNTNKPASEILASFNNVVSASATNLVAYYRFDEGTPCGINTSTTSLPDLSGNSNTGTLTNFDLSTPDCTSNWIPSYAMVVPNPVNPVVSACDAITFSWAAPNFGIWEKYYLEVAEDAAFQNRVSGYDPFKDMGTSLNEYVSGLNQGTEYFFRLRAFHSIAGDMGGYSLVKSILLEDTQNPLIACPGNQYIDKNESCQAIVPDFTSLATASDNCSVPVVSQSPPSGTTVSSNTTITLTATDGNGNTANCNFQLILEDNSNPILSCPGDQTEPASVGCNAVLGNYISLVTASDNCDASLTITQTPVSGTAISTTTLVTITATDDDGNQSQCSFNVTPADAAAPSLSCPGNQTEAANENCELVLPDYTGLAVVSDLCDANPTLVQSPAAGTIISTTTAVTLTASDAGGNSTDCTFNVYVTDQTPPTGTNPGDQGVTPNALCNANLPDFRSLIGATDNCDASVTVNQVPTIGTAMTGTTSVTLYAIDNDGNFTTFTFNAYIDDNTNPTINGPGDQTFYAPENCQIAVEDYTNQVIVNDNCDDDLLIVQTPTPGTIISETTNVSITATDDAGNIGTHSFYLIVNDITDPTISYPSTIYACADENIIDYVVTANDNCSVELVQTAGLPSGSEFPVGETVNSFLATDVTGNMATCSFSVIIYSFPDVNLPDQIICEGEDFLLDATPTEPGTYSYLWNNESTLASFVVNLEVGIYNYIVTVTNSYGCATIDTAELTVEICEGISIKDKNSISIFPNPGNGLVYSENTEGYSVSVKDITGKVIIEKESLINREQFDLRHLLPGVYVFEFRKADEKIFLRFINY